VQHAFEGVGGEGAQSFFVCLFGCHREVAHTDFLDKFVPAFGCCVIINGAFWVPDRFCGEAALDLADGCVAVTEKELLLGLF
jgi:hypothetical protein